MPFFDHCLRVRVMVSSPVALGGLAHEMFLQFPLAHTEVIQNASLAPKTAKEPWGDVRNMAWGHTLPNIAHVFLISTCFLAWSFFWGAFVFSRSPYLRAEWSVIFETWRLACILFSHHIGAIFDKNLKSNVSIDSNLWNVMGTIKTSCFICFVVIFIHLPVRSASLLMPWEVEETGANKQCQKCSLHLEETLSWHIVWQTHPITNYLVLPNSILKLGKCQYSTYSEWWCGQNCKSTDKKQSSSYCTNSKKSILRYRQLQIEPTLAHWEFRTVSYNNSSLLIHASIPDLISAPGTHLKTSGCNAKLCFSFSTEQCRFWYDPYLASCLEVVISNHCAAMMVHSSISFLWYFMIFGSLLL